MLNESINKTSSNDEIIQMKNRFVIAEAYKHKGCSAKVFKCIMKDHSGFIDEGGV